jgi:Ferric iron reductase FhuF-like transporter
LATYTWSGTVARVRYAHALADPLAPVVAALSAMRARHGAVRVDGVRPDLLVPPGSAGWVPATRCADGTALPRLVDAAVRQWSAPRHVAATLAWKQYSYWLLLPAVLGYAAARRVPVMAAGNVLLRPAGSAALVRVGLATPRVAMLAGDPLAGAPGSIAVPDEAALVGMLRRSVLDDHLTPMLARLREQAKVGRRTLLGSVASAVCYALVRAHGDLPGDRTASTVATLLAGLGVADLVELTPDLMIRRRTCCLAFTLPEPKICAGCCIQHESDPVN